MTVQRNFSEPATLSPTFASHVAKPFIFGVLFAFLSIKICIE